MPEVCPRLSPAALMHKNTPNNLFFISNKLLGVAKSYTFFVKE
jgi:hypothetical protein